MKKSCLIAVIATLAAVAGALAAVRRSWTSTSVCCSARIPPPPLRKSLLRPKTRPQKRLLPLRILPNNAGRNRTK
jgi:hypothetical protein